MKMELKGMVSDIQRTSVHDGPGIRTTVFLKGCNMRCSWCHNPETISMKTEILLNDKKCIGCGLCGEGCYAGAKVICGKEMTVSEVFEHVLLDKPYYGNEGGITISGGEAFLQPEFAISLLKMCKENGISTAVETNLSLSFEIIEKAIPFVDYWMVDLKIFNNELHKKYTSIDNKTILINIVKLDEKAKQIIIRTPVMKDVNDGENELFGIGEFLSKLENLIYYELLPYHPLGLSKIVENGILKMEKFEQPDSLYLKKIAIEISKKYKIAMRIANKPV